MNAATFSRRRLLQMGGAGALGLGTPGLLAARVGSGETTKSKFKSTVKDEKSIVVDMSDRGKGGPKVNANGFARRNLVSGEAHLNTSNRVAIVR